jgi:hypothetical protein
MIRIKYAFLVIIFIVFSTFAIGITAENDFVENQKEINQQNMFDAEITFYILTGEGCGCTPIPDATISAYGGEGNSSGVTNEDGLCILTLVILGEYEIIIEADEFQSINFEFNVIDDQSFTFHMFEKRESSLSHTSFLPRLITKILSI